MADPSDAELLNRLRHGEKSALEPLVRRWEHAVYQIAWRVVGNTAEAEEVRQTVFLRMLERPHRLPQADSLAAWMRRCTVNAAISVVRRRRRIARPLPDGLREYRDEPPEQPLFRAEEAARLRDALEQFSPEDRALLSLRFDENLPFSEIAVALDRPPSTVKSRYTRLIGRLRSQLDPVFEETDRHV